MCHGTIRHHLFHKCELVVTFFKIPNIEDNINAIIH